MDATPTAATTCYRIGDLILDTGTRRVTRDGKSLHLGALTFDLLLALAEAAPELASHDDLAERVWDGRPVTPETITQRVKMLREALSDDVNEPRYIEGIRGHGYRLVCDVEAVSEQPGPAKRGPVLRIGVTAVAVIALLVFVGTRLFNDNESPSVAVLPFADMSPLGDQAHLADGIAEELITELAQLEGLYVASRTSSFSFRDASEDIRTIADKLGVAAILEGSVRKSGDEIRITVQLIDADADVHLWAETFDRKVEDVFAIQDEIAAATAGALGVTMGVGGIKAFSGAGTRNFAAYEAYLQGDYELAIEIDPDYAAAWARQGIRIMTTKWDNPPEEAPRISDLAEPYIKRAIELDPEAASAHHEFATLHYGRMQWQTADDLFNESLALRRDWRTLYSYANMLMRSGRIDRSQALRVEHGALDRVPRPYSRLQHFTDIADGDLARARAVVDQLRENRRPEARVLIALNDGTPDELRSALEAVPPTDAVRVALYDKVLDVLDSPEQVLAILRDVFADAATTWPAKYHDIALLAAYFGDPEFALEVFSREIRYTTIRYAALWYPVMAEARRLPRFKELVTDANLVEYWREYGWADYCRPRGPDDFACF